jgi:hypothetical protein
MFDQYNKVIELMLSLAAERAEFERTLNARQAELDELHAASGEAPGGLDEYVSCFTAMPFSDPRARDIYGAVRTVLEDNPYYWAVVRADDSVEQPGLWTNLKAKLLRAHCYVAILTGEVNPNVMIEIGRMEALERPLVLLRDSQAPDLPADLKGLLYADLSATGEALADEVREALARQEPFQALRGDGDRFLSETVLVRATGLNDQLSREISRRYKTWRAFQQADAATVARNLGLRHPATIEAAQQALTGEQ